MKKNRRRLWIYAIWLLILSGMMLLALSWGSYTITFSELIQTLQGAGTSMQNFAVFTLRLPRIVLAMMVGSALAASGGLLQDLTKNELADAGMIGINAGASLAAVVFILVQGSLPYQAMNQLTVFTLPFIAMLGAFLSAVVIYLISGRRKFTPTRLLLNGIGMNIGINALIAYLSFKGSAGDYNRVLVWTNGSLWGSSWIHVLALLPLLLIPLTVIIHKHQVLDVLSLGDDVATGLGLSVATERKFLLCMAVILAGGATAFAGSISFLGLLGPHIARSLIGNRHKHTICLSMIISSVLILFADCVSRNVFSPLEVPVGITISLIGVPYFIYLMLKEKSS